MTRQIWSMPARLRADQRGVSVLEFALGAPVFFAVLLSAMDFAHTLYVKASLQGEIELAARNSSLETAPTSLTAIDSRLRAQIQRLNKSAVVTFERKAYQAYTNVVVKAEPYTETSGDSSCNHGETYSDLNNNGSWDLDSGQVGLGSAGNIIQYTVNISYPRLFPLVGRVTGSPNVNLTIKTFLRNQPYDATPATVTKTCA